MNKKTTTGFTAAVIAVAMLAVTAGCGAPVAAASAAPAAEPGITVTAASPVRGDLALTTSFVGSIQPDQVVSVLPKLGGTVKEVKVTPGQLVKKGDVLMVLDDKDVQQAVVQAQAGYDATKANMDKTIGSGLKSQLAGLDAQADAAINGYEDAKSNQDMLERQRDTLPGQLAILEAIPEEERTEEDRLAIIEMRKTIATLPTSLAAAEQMVERTKQSRDNARNSYKVNKIEGEAETQVVVDATLKQAEVSLNSAKDKLADTKVTSPIDGVVETVSVTVLNMASPTAPAFVISNKEALSVSFNVPSTSIAALKVGGAVTVQKGSTDYPATITEVSTAINQQTGLFTVKASLNTAAAELLTGVMVKVTAPTQQSSNTLLVAQDSVYFDDGQAYVYIATPENLAKKVFIEVGISTPEQVEVLSGITDSDAVVTSWHPNLIDGALLAIES